MVLDFQMPELTGSDVQRALKNSQIEVPVIVMTAHDQPTLRAQCMADGASCLLHQALAPRRPDGGDRYGNSRLPTDPDRLNQLD